MAAALRQLWISYCIYLASITEIVGGVKRFSDKSLILIKEGLPLIGLGFPHQTS